MTVREHDNLRLPNRATIDDDLELMSLRRLSDSLEATRAMLHSAQKLARETQDALIGLANEFCGAELQKQQTQNTELIQVAPDELSALLRSRFKTLKLLSGNGATFRLSEANQTIIDLRAELETQRNQANHARQQVKRLENQVRSLERTLEKERHSKMEGQEIPQTAAVETVLDEVEAGEFQAWYTNWKRESRGWERACDVVLLIGAGKLSLSIEIEQALAQEKSVSRRTIQRAIRECVKSGLLEQESIVISDGRPPQRCILTAKGRWLYQELTGIAPQAGDHMEMLKTHKSERHLAVIVKTAELFTHLGYQVERQPLRLEINANRSFQPDLVMKKGGETFYLEVETGDKEKQSLNQKWENALAAGGRICVATDNMNTLRRIQGDIARWSIFEGCSVILYITCLSFLKARHANESPWYAIKEYEPR
jgi:hypothetical protein